MNLALFTFTPVEVPAGTGECPGSDEKNTKELRRADTLGLCFHQFAGNESGKAARRQRRRARRTELSPTSGHDRHTASKHLNRLTRLSQPITQPAGPKPSTRKKSYTRVNAAMAHSERKPSDGSDTGSQLTLSARRACLAAGWRCCDPSRPPRSPWYAPAPQACGVLATEKCQIPGSADSQRPVGVPVELASCRETTI